MSTGRPGQITQILFVPALDNSATNVHSREEIGVNLDCIDQTQISDRSQISVLGQNPE